jgi:ribosome-associated protein
MKQELLIKNGISIPMNEIDVTFSRSGGPGGQHVNKTETRVTVTWNVKNTNSLTDEQKARVIKNVRSHMTSDGNVVVHNSDSRSQQDNKEHAFLKLVELITKALYVPKKRMKTKISKATKEARLQKKSRHSTLKKARSKKFSAYE